MAQRFCEGGPARAAYPGPLTNDDAPGRRIPAEEEAPPPNPAEQAAKPDETIDFTCSDAPPICLRPRRRYARVHPPFGARRKLGAPPSTVLAERSCPPSFDVQMAVQAVLSSGSFEQNGVRIMGRVYNGMVEGYVQVLTRELKRPANAIIYPFENVKRRRELFYQDRGEVQQVLETLSCSLRAQLSPGSTSSIMEKMALLTAGLAGWRDHGEVPSLHVGIQDVRRDLDRLAAELQPPTTGSAVPAVQGVPEAAQPAGSAAVPAPVTRTAPAAVVETQTFQGLIGPLVRRAFADAPIPMAVSQEWSRRHHLLQADMVRTVYYGPQLLGTFQLPVEVVANIIQPSSKEHRPRLEDRSHSPWARNRRRRQGRHWSWVNSRNALEAQAGSLLGV